MTRIVIVLLLILCGPHLVAQNITAVEYFFDADPGHGNGTAVTVTPATVITDLTFNVNIAAQADGFHTLFVRAKDANNMWSPPYSRPFYKLSPADVAPAVNINKIEYFFDADPGFGAGINVPITPGLAITDHSFAIPLTSTTDGFHTLYVRTRDANNRWSTAYSRPFYKLSASVGAPAANINKVEYFIDADPGFGAGVNIPITPAVTITDLSVNIPMTSLSVGSHRLTIRARDANNTWGIVVIKNFLVCNHPGTTANAATAITSSGFNLSWADVPGSISYQLDVSTDNFTTFVSGYQAKVITAPSLSTSVTGLSQATTYQYRVRAVSSCVSVESNTRTVNTLATPPTAQPTNLLFSSVTSSSLTAFFTQPSTVPTGYLVVRKVNSSPTFVPANNTTYTLGQTVGDGTVAYVGSSFLFNESGLTSNTRYYYDIFSYNQANGMTTYLTTSPLENNVITVAVEPTAQATNLQFNSVTDASFQVSFTAAAGSPGGYLVLKKTGSAPTEVPVDGTTYTTSIGSDEVVHNGAATSFAQNGLSQNTEYFYAVYAYNGSGTSINYRTTTPLQGSKLTPITPPASPTAINFTNVTPSSMTVQITSAAQAPSGYLVVRKQGSNPAFVPQINTSYTFGQTLSDGVVAYVGPGTLFDQTGLTASTTYYYDVFAFNQQSSLISYQTVAPLEGNRSTFTAEPSAHPSGLTVTNPTESSLKVTFTAASPAPSGYIVLRKVGSAPGVTPVDGTAYVVGETISDAVVAFVGTGLTFDDNALASGTNYFYRAFSFNGSGSSTNYLTSAGASNTGSGLTVPGKPPTPAATTIGQTSFTVNWTAATGAANYRLDVSKDNFATMVGGYDDVTVNATSIVVTSLEPGIAYKFRIRAVNTSGTSVNSDAAQQFTISPTPELSAATNVGQDKFTANWSPVTGAAEYFIDVSSNDFTTFLTGYQNKSITGTTNVVVTGLLAGTSYNYRVRSANSGGTSPSSPQGGQLLYPATPVGQNATGTTSTSFNANWVAVIPGVTEYRLDVTLVSNNFNPSLPEYTNVLVTDNIQSPVNNLTPNTAYRYRVRAVNATGASPSSTAINVTTLQPGTGVDLKVASVNFTPSFTGSSSEVTAAMEGGTPPYKVTFHYKKIMGTDETSRLLTSTSATFKTTVDASMLDELGVAFYFSVTDATGAEDESDEQFIYKAIPAAGVAIPFTKSGGVAESYEIFSIPYEINDNLVGSIFEELGEIDKSKWRLLRYQGGRNTDLGLVGRIEPGKGYWFNRKENTTIQFSGGTVTKANREEPFVLQLEKGWNQVGNPFPFDIKWADVLAANNDVTGIGKLRVFNPSGFHLNDESAVLKSWSGGFVHNANDGSVALKFPVSLKNSSGRVAGGAINGSRLDAEEWSVPVVVKHGHSLNALATFGMHRDASTSADRFDDFVVPRFLNYLEFYTEHKEFFSPLFSSDIVPLANGHTWDFRFESSADPEATLEWDNTGFGTNGAQLMLYDVNRKVLIDMRTERSYRFQPQAGQSFRVFYGRTGDDIVPDITSLGNPHPNPFNGHVTIPFILERDGSSVNISVTDALGRDVRTLLNRSVDRGMHSVTWDGTSPSNELVSGGLYFVRMNVDGVRKIVRVIKY